MAQIEINGKSFKTKLLTWREAMQIKRMNDEEAMAEEMVRVGLGGALSIQEIQDLPLETMTRLIDEISIENGVTGD
tara:strand:+ start:4238 stop:4465 length:228 start_codon:yes stop_codon:yes gene_type:complete